MIHVVLYEPEIPPNTGNIMRLCANTGARLHLVEPLGFALDDRRLRRAGLDYREFSEVSTYKRLKDCLASCLVDGKLYPFSTRGGRSYSDVAFEGDDVLLFGPETRGLPAAVLESVPEPQRLRIPMRGQSRSLNLSNAVAVAVFEAWRQLGFPGGS